MGTKSVDCMAGALFCSEKLSKMTFLPFIEQKYFWQENLIFRIGDINMMSEGGMEQSMWHVTWQYRR